MYKKINFIARFGYPIRPLLSQRILWMVASNAKIILQSYDLFLPLCHKKLELLEHYAFSEEKTVCYIIEGTCVSEGHLNDY